MGKIPLLALLPMLVACANHGDDGLEERAMAPQPKPPEPKLPPVPDGHVRIRPIEPVPRPDPFAEESSPHAWAFEWLAADGWSFTGWELESAGDGHALLRWHDPRRPGREFATLDLGLRSGKKLHLYLGLRHDRLRAGPHRIECQECGKQYELRGSITGDPVDCRSCGKKISVDPEWDRAPTREFRILLLGSARHAKGGPMLKAAGATLRIGAGSDTRTFVGRLPRESVLDPSTNTFDPVRVQHGATRVLNAGEHVFARMFHYESGGSSSFSVNSHNKRKTFSQSSGDTSFEGTEEGYVIRVRGEPVELADYPHAVWEFTLAWKRGE